MDNKITYLITGYYGCKCHPFTSWEECRKMENQKININQKVKHRCTGKIGIVRELDEFNTNFCIVFFKNGHPTGELEHVSNLIKI